MKSFRNEFKALATNKETGEKEIITVRARSKRQALSFIRENGYRLSNNKCKPAALFDWIVNQNYSDRKERERYWNLNQIPEA